MMERPFFSLAKSKRAKPIDHTSPDGKLWVHVSANPDYGMATIWLADILIHCASQLADITRRGIDEVPRTLHIMPYDLLRASAGSTARRASTQAGRGGVAISMPVLFEKSRGEGRYRRFKFEMLKLAEKDALPGYALAVEARARGGGPKLRMTRVPGKDGAEHRPRADHVFEVSRPPCAAHAHRTWCKTFAPVWRGAHR